MMASISAVAVMVTNCCDLKNRNSAIRKSEAAHSPGFWPLPASCTPELMAARIDALLTPPTPDMKTSFGIEPCISRRTSWIKDISAQSSVYIQHAPPMAESGCACRQLIIYVAATPFDSP